MFLILQFPLGDLRSFVTEHSRLPHPAWPQPGVGQYLRSAGQVRRRHLGGLNNWIGESKICHANHALRFSGDRNDFKIDGDIALEPCFRRFFFDGYIAGKFEIGFRVNAGSSPIDLDKQDFNRMLAKLFSHPVHIARHRDEKAIPLISAGRKLAGFYASASTSGRPVEQERQDAALVEPGAPLLFIEAGAEDRVRNPFHAKEIAGLDTSRVTLSHFWLNNAKLSNTEIRCWLMHCRGGRTDYARELRISLLRLNASRVGLEVLADALRTKRVSPEPFSEQSERLQLYLSDVVDRYVRVPPEFQHSSLLGIALQSENAVLANDAGLLIDILKTETRIRRQVLGKAERSLATLSNAIQSNAFSSERFNLIMGDQISGDKYEAGQVVTQGANAKTEVQQVTFNQIWQQNKEKVDLGALGAELATLRSELGAKASAPEHYIEIGAIASAEVEAGKGNGEKVYEALAKAGKWSLEVAEKIGIGVATAALKTSLGV